MKTTDDLNFFERVWEVARAIPYGRVTSYGAIAKCLGSKGSARMVGWAMNKTAAMDIPAHRVVNRNGLLTGKCHFGDSSAMEEALKKEGIEVVDNQIVNFQQVFWDPAELMEYFN